MNAADRDERRAPDRDTEAGALPGETVNPTSEDEYWRRNWSSRPYTDRNRDYEHYRPAFRFGWESRSRFRDCKWEEVEPQLASEWGRHGDRQRATLRWDEARLAARDAWQRLERIARTGNEGRPAPSD